MLRSFVLLLSFCMVVLTPISQGADLDLEPVTLFKCWRALRKLSTRATPTIPSKLSKKIGDQIISVPTFTRLNSEEMKKIFEGAAEGLTAKADGLAYRTVDGSLTVLFWPRKRGALEGSISHREAAETIIQNELTAINSYLSKPKNEKLSLLLEAQENLTALLGQLKSSSQTPQEITERFFGFQIQAKKTAPQGEIKINSIDFDPTFNGRSSIGSIMTWTEEFQTTINAVSKSIAPPYKPEIYRIEESVFNTFLGPLKLTAPKGSQITSFSAH